MEGHQDAVGGDVDIGLHIAEAEVDRVGEGGQGVLRDVAGAAAVGEGERAVPVEIRVHCHRPPLSPIGLPRRRRADLE